MRDNSLNPVSANISTAPAQDDTNIENANIRMAPARDDTNTANDANTETANVSMASPQHDINFTATCHARLMQSIERDWDPLHRRVASIGAPGHRKHVFDRA
jgi:hypothetical protein